MDEKLKQSNLRQRQLTIDFVNSLKTPCAKCGERRLYVLDFHHIDPNTKKYDIQYGLRSHGRKALKNEIKKCVCLCKNCHTEFHYLYGGTPNDPVNDLKEYLTRNDL